MAGRGVKPRGCLVVGVETGSLKGAYVGVSVLMGGVIVLECDDPKSLIEFALCEAR